MAMRFIESKEGLDRFTKDPDKAKAGLARTLITAAKAWREAYGDITPSTQAVQPKEPRTAQTGAIEPIRYAIEIPTVSEELYNRTREAVEQAGYKFVVPIRSVSIEDLLTEDRQREQEGKPRRLGYVNHSKTMRATVSPEMEVAINPVRFKIEGSNLLPTHEQKKKIKEREADLRGQIPQDLQSFVVMEMVDPSTISQLEDAYMDSTGELLLPDYFARTDVQTVRGSAALVGRVGPSNGRSVIDWDCGFGRGSIFAVSVVVLPRK